MLATIDHRRRIDAIQAALAERRIDALVGTRLKTVTHVAGAFVPWRSAAVVPAAGAPAVITLMMDAARAADESWLGDVSHNAIMGKPTPAQRDLAGAYVESCHQLVALMQPGRRLGEVAALMSEFVSRKGWSEVVLPGYGHGIGHFGHEWFPCVVTSDDPRTTDADVELVPNYVQEIAIVCNRPGVAGFRLERPLLITATGNELLSGLPFAPWVVDEGCVC